MTKQPAPQQNMKMLVISAADMRTAWQKRQAIPLHPILSEFMHYDGSWWLLDTPDWVRVTDPALTELLDTQHQKMNP